MRSVLKNTNDWVIWLFGYVKPIWKDNRGLRTPYKQCYCGLCKRLKKTYGVRGMCTLSYEATLTGLLYLGLSEDEPEVSLCCCSVSCVRFVKAVKYDDQASAALSAMSIILVYNKLMDDYGDENKRLPERLFRSKHKKARSAFPETAHAVSMTMDMIANAEQMNCSLDVLLGLNADIVLSVFRAVFASYGECEFFDTLMNLGACIGKWIYLADAISDLASDKKKGLFNPFARSEQADAIRTASGHMETLLSDISKAVSELPLRRYRDTVSYVLGESLRSKTADIFSRASM